jgi:hypothetical protein
MNREQRELAIDILKNGYLSRQLDGNCCHVFASFGQLDPEIQAVAREIKEKDGINVFEVYGYITESKQVKIRRFIVPARDDFDICASYRLRPDYIDKPKEPEKVSMKERLVIIGQYLNTAQEQLGVLREEIK